MEGMYDRIDAVGKSVLGLSIQCAQCHSHKFDPITHTEYYGMFAFLNNTYEGQSWVYADTQRDVIAEIEVGIAAVEHRLRRQHPNWAQRMAVWEKQEMQQRQVLQWRVVQAVDLHSKTELNHPTSLYDHSILTLGHPTNGDDLQMIAEPELNGVTGVRFEVLTYGDLPFGGPGRSYKGTWALTELVVEKKTPGSDQWERLKLMGVTADFAELEHKLEDEWRNKVTYSKDGVIVDQEAGEGKKDGRIVGPAEFLADGSDDTAWRADRGLGRRNTDAVAVAQFEEPLTAPAGTQLRFLVRTRHGGNVPDPFDQGPKNTQIGRFRISLTTAADPKVNNTPHAAVLAMQTSPHQRTETQRAEVFAAWRLSVPEFEAFNSEITALQERYPDAPTSVLHLAERTGAHARSTFRLERGIWTNPVERVAAHTPASLHPLLKTSVPDRLTFARWLVDENSPLTARVQVNRVWQAMFGTGLVPTPEDFGTRAPQPVYQNVLDWLSVDFMERGWSLKQLLRTIASSATYQQDSRATPQMVEMDPSNALLARGSRFRAEAEVLRDIALSVSGLLHEKVGGPGIFPPIPQSVIDFNYVKPDYWYPPEGRDRYRRSLYVFRKRSMPDPSLTSFDAPNADISCARRVRSNTPLSALVSLNEPIFVEAAQAMALRVLREGGTSEADRVDYAFRLCTSRGPTPEETEEVLKLLQNRRRQLAEGWISINQIATGDSAENPEIPPHATPQDAAAWTIAARVLLNLDETLSKN